MKNYLLGQRFGKLTVIGETDERINKAIVWKCRCDCGNEILVESRKLTSGKVKCCGCEKKCYPQNIKNIRFGKLIALNPTDKRTESGYVMWRCRCDCGNEVLVSRNNLVQGYTSSCGCMKVFSNERLLGRRFGNLTVIKRCDDGDSRNSWYFRCDCGREFNAKGYEVFSGKITDCGCSNSAPMEEIEEKRLTYPLKGRMPKENSSGYKGVSFNKAREKWVARVMVGGINHYLGSYDNLTDAINARNEGLEKFSRLGR